MEFSLSALSSIKQRLSFSLTSILGVVWWVLFGLGLALLLLDCFVFYLYGLGYAKLSAVPDAGIVRVHENSIRATASLVEKTREEFLAPLGTTSIPNPFR